MSKIKVFLVTLILLLGLFLHLHNYATYPQRGASSDEYTYSFLGVSLLTKGVPISWSNVARYQHVTNLTIRGIYFPIVSPYFDHPPLNGLLVGGWALLHGEQTFQSIDLATIRLVPIFLSVLTSLLVFLILYKLYTFRIALYALLIYTTTTIFVMNTRVVFAENLLTPLFLGALYFFISTNKQLTVWKVIMLGVFAGLSFWTKEFGIVTYVTLAFLFLYERTNKKYFFVLTGTFALFVLGYIAYGMHYDAQVFWNVIGAQASRIIGPQTLLMLLFNPIIVNKPYIDGWYIFGFLTLFYLMKDLTKYKYIVIPALLYLFILLFSINREGEMGWYMIVLFPFMAMASAVFISEATMRKNWLMLFFLSFVGLYEIEYLYGSLFGLTTMQYRVLLFLLFGPFLLGTVLLPEERWRTLCLFYFYLMIVGNIFLTYSYIHPA